MLNLLNNIKTKDKILIRTNDLQEPEYKNQVEALAYEFLDKTFKPDIILYEPMALNSPGGTYTPDFMLVINNRLLFVEVKSSWNAPGAARTKRSMKEIASTYQFLGIFIALIVNKYHQKNRVKIVDEWRTEIVSNGRFKVVEINYIEELFNEDE